MVFVLKMVNRWMHIDGGLSLVREMAGEVNRLGDWVGSEMGGCRVAEWGRK